jgi:hypothetical protein
MALRAAFQYYADKGRLMTIRRADTEEITLLDEDAYPLATLRTEPMRYITDIWETRDIDDDYVLTSLVCDYIPPIDQFEVVWGSFRGIRNIIVTDIKMHKGCVRDLSKDALLSGTRRDLQSLEKKCPKILEKIDAPLRPAELLPYMRAEDGWTEEMIAAMVKDLPS